MPTAQAAQNHGDKWDLTWYLQWGIYLSTSIWTHSQNAVAFADVTFFFKKHKVYFCLVFFDYG